MNKKEKKFLGLAVVFVFLVIALFFLVEAKADIVPSNTIDLTTIISKFPALNQDVFYSFTNHQVQYAVSATFISLANDMIHIDAGYTPASEVVVLASLKLVDMGKIISFPILKYVVLEPFVTIGATNLIGNSQKKFDYGAGIKIISVKF